MSLIIPVWSVNRPINALIAKQKLPVRRSGPVRKIDTPLRIVDYPTSYNLTDFRRVDVKLRHGFIEVLSPD